MDLNFWTDEVVRLVREGKSIRKACFLVKIMKNKADSDDNTLLKEIRQARDRYRELLIATKFSDDTITLDECRVARNKLGRLIYLAKQQNIEGNIEVRRY